MASVQELLLAAQSKAKRSPFSQLNDLLDTGIESYQTGQKIGAQHVDTAIKLIQKQQLEERLAYQKQRKKEREDEIKNGLNGASTKPNPAYPGMKLTVTLDENGDEKRSFTTVEPKAETFSAREYVDSKGVKRIGKWSDINGLITSDADAVADTPGSRNEMNKASFDLRDEFIKLPETKEYVTVNTQVKSMDSMLSNALKGNLKNQLALDQALITMYNKLNDPTSVVRESEYARTPENLPIVNRISGAIDKLSQGGAGLTNEDREALVIGAKIIANERGKVYQNRRDNYDKLSGQYGIDSSMVTGTVEPFSPYEIKSSSNSQGTNNSSGGITIDENALDAEIERRKLQKKGNR